MSFTQRRCPPRVINDLLFINLPANSTINAAKNTSVVILKYAKKIIKKKRLPSMVLAK